MFNDFAYKINIKVHYSLVLDKLEYPSYYRLFTWDIAMVFHLVWVFLES